MPHYIRDRLTEIKWCMSSKLMCFTLLQIKILWNVCLFTILFSPQASGILDWKCQCICYKYSAKICVLKHNVNYKNSYFQSVQTDKELNKYWIKIKFSSYKF